MPSSQMRNLEETCIKVLIPLCFSGAEQFAQQSVNIGVHSDF